MSQDVSLVSGSIISEEALVLGSIPYKERDRIVTLMTESHGRIRVFARAAARSRKRFAGALDSIQVVQAQLKVPRDLNQDNGLMWGLESADLKEVFPQWRMNYGAMENMFFLIKFVCDIVPEGHSENQFYRGIMSFLRIDPSQKLFQNPVWWRMAFWTWATAFLGFGSLMENLVGPLYSSHPKWPELWGEILLAKQPNIAKLVRAFEKINPVPLSLKDETKVYETWVQVSGIHWEYYEKWLKTKKVGI